MSSIRTGGRSAIVKARVFAAASDLVEIKGLQNVTIPEIAQRAGVAATSLYRRWKDVGALLLDLAVERLSHKRPLPDKGSIKEDLKCWSRNIARGLKSNEGANFFRVLIATSDVEPEKRTMALAPRREQLEHMLERSRARGERTPSVDEVIDHLLAPLYMRALLGLPINKAFAEQLVERLLNSFT